MKILNKLEKVVLDISVLLFIILIGIVVFQMTSRNFFGKSYAKLEELAIILLPWFGFFSATYTLYRCNHVQIEFVYNKLPVMTRKAIFLLTQVALLVVVTNLFYYNIGLAIRQMKLVTPALGWPMGVTYIGFLICAPFMVVPLIFNIYHLLTGSIDEFKINGVLNKEEAL